MRANINLDKNAIEELDELSGTLNISKSELIRSAVKEFYLKEKRARENLLFFLELYNKRIVTKDLLFLLLPRKDAESVIIGSKFGKEAAELVKEVNY